MAAAAAFVAVPVPAPAQAKPAVVIIDDPRNDDPPGWGFDPAELTVALGTTVVWRNDGEYSHTVTSEDGKTDGVRFSSPNLGPGSRFKHTFEDPGVYRYFCSPHPWMKALIRVR